MPVYKCPKCGRTVELPEGKYYCKVCGPATLMVRELVYGDYVTVKNVHGTFVVGEYATASYSGVIDYLRLYGVPDDIIEEYYPKIKTLRHGEALKIPKHHSSSKYPTPKEVEERFVKGVGGKNQFEDFLRNLFVAEGYPNVRVEKRGENAYDVVLFYETAHPSWVYLRFYDDKVDVHFSYAIRTPYIPISELKRMFGISPKEWYSGYVYVRLKSPILIWANVWENEIHLHHRNIIRDYELKSYLPMAVREIKRVVEQLKKNPRSMLEGRPRLYVHKPEEAIPLIHEVIPYEAWRERVEMELKRLNAEALREWQYGHL